MAWNPGAGAHPAVVERARSVAGAPAEGDRILDAWRTRFRAVADRKLRRSVLASCLAETDDGSVIGALHRLDARAAGGEPDFRWIQQELALSPSVLGELPEGRALDLYAGAQAAELPTVAQRFLGLYLAREAPRAENPHHGGSPGQRIALARGRDRMVLDRLLHDRDVRVATVLLDNPRFIERDVVRMAALRPTDPEILRRIAGHPRWGQRPQVRRALAFNPSTPPALARQVLGTLLRQDLVELAGSAVLSEELRGEAGRLLSASGRNADDAG